MRTIPWALLALVAAGALRRPPTSNLAKESQPPPPRAIPSPVAVPTAEPAPSETARVRLTLSRREWSLQEVIRLVSDSTRFPVIVDAAKDLGDERLALEIHEASACEALTILCLVFGVVWSWQEEPGVAVVCGQSTSSRGDLEYILKSHAQFARASSPEEVLRGLLRCITTALEIVSAKSREVEVARIEELHTTRAVCVQETGQVPHRSVISRRYAELEERVISLQIDAKRIERLLAPGVTDASRRTFVHRGRVTACYLDAGAAMTSLGYQQGIRVGDTIVVRRERDVVAWIQVEEVYEASSLGRLTPAEGEVPIVDDACHD